jgi:hypothetical protein
MKAIIHRLRRLENAAAPDKWEQINRAIAERIREARRRRLGADYVEPIPFPPGSFDGCRTMADHIIRARCLHMEREGIIRHKTDEDDKQRSGCA